MKNVELLEQFQEMKAMALFEMEVGGDYYTYYIEADADGIHAGGYSK